MVWNKGLTKETDSRVAKMAVVNQVSQIKRWKNPKEHEKTSVGQKKRFEDPKECEKQFAAIREGWNKPGVKEKASVIKIGKIGKNSNNYRGGITPLYNLLRNSLKSKQWTKDVFTRDNFTCQKCGDNSGGNLEAHHEKPFSVILHENNITTYEEAMNCIELWDINNGITLCKECHKKEQALTNKLIKEARKEEDVV